MDSLGRKIRMSFFDASDGPRIMLFGPMDVDLVALQQFFLKMSRKCVNERLDSQEFVVAFHGIQVLAKCSGPGAANASEQGIFRRQVKSSDFEWTRSSGGWDYLAELIDGLVLSKTAGHQYLSRYPEEHAIVVVSKGEYSDEVLSQ